MKPAVLLTLLLIFSISCSDTTKSCPDKICADFISQQAAQTAYDSDQQCYNSLDADNDGIACEQYFTTSGTTSGGTTGGTSGCPTTANCGCSNKTMSQCASACCKWVVGSGCKCK